jgi:hypothetical protein
VGGMDHLKVQDVEEYTYFCYIHVLTSSPPRVNISI